MIESVTSPKGLLSLVHEDKEALSVVDELLSVVAPESVGVPESDAADASVLVPSGAAQELTPSARTDTRNRMSRKYRRKLETDMSQLHEWIVNLLFRKTDNKKCQPFFSD